jgi:hypothetical protein
MTAILMVLVAPTALVDGGGVQDDDDIGRQWLLERRSDQLYVREAEHPKFQSYWTMVCGISFDGIYGTLQSSAEIIGSLIAAMTMAVYQQGLPIVTGETCFGNFFLLCGRVI